MVCARVPATRCATTARAHMLAVDDVEMPHRICILDATIFARRIVVVANVYKVEALLLPPVKKAEDGLIGEANLHAATQTSRISAWPRAASGRCVHTMHWPSYRILRASASVSLDGCEKGTAMARGATTRGTCRETGDTPPMSSVSPMEHSAVKSVAPVAAEVADSAT